MKPEHVAWLHAWLNGSTVDEAERLLTHNTDEAWKRVALAQVRGEDEREMALDAVQQYYLRMWERRYPTTWPGKPLDDLARLVDRHFVESVRDSIDAALGRGTPECFNAQQARRRFRVDIETAESQLTTVRCQYSDSGQLVAPPVTSAGIAAGAALPSWELEVERLVQLAISEVRPEEYARCAPQALEAALLVWWETNGLHLASRAALAALIGLGRDEARRLALRGLRWRTPEAADAPDPERKIELMRQLRSNLRHQSVRKVLKNKAHKNLLES
jgi:hypothetical protein